MRGNPVDSAVFANCRATRSLTIRKDVRRVLRFFGLWRDLRGVISTSTFGGVLKILVCYHKPADIIASDILAPILCGAQNKGADEVLDFLNRCKKAGAQGFLDCLTLAENNKLWQDFRRIDELLTPQNTAQTPPQNPSQTLPNSNLSEFFAKSEREISAQNANFCELSALFWAWKNLREEDAAGLFHYRRMLDFTRECAPQPPSQNAQTTTATPNSNLTGAGGADLSNPNSILNTASAGGAKSPNSNLANKAGADLSNPNLNGANSSNSNFAHNFQPAATAQNPPPTKPTKIRKLTRQTLPKFALTRPHIARALARCDIIAPAPHAVNLRRHWLDLHDPRDLDAALAAATALDPRARADERIAATAPACFGNIFIAKREFFLDFCQWIFAIIAEISPQIAPRLAGYNAYQARLWGFLSEVFFNVWLDGVRGENGENLAAMPADKTTPANETNHADKTLAPEPNSNLRARVAHFALLEIGAQKPLFGWQDDYKWRRFFLFGVRIFKRPSRQK